MSTPVAILVRVSTAKQETERQEHELRAVAEANRWTVVEVIRETVSGRAKAADRAGLDRIRELVAGGKVRKVLVHEVSRLSRRTSVVHTVVEEMEERGVSLYWHAQRIETLLPTGKRNPAAAIMLALLAEMARAETETLRERINSGLDDARRKGVTLGRRKGTVKDRDTLLADHADIVRHLKANQSTRNAATLTGKSTATVQKVRKILNRKTPTP